MNSKKDQKVEMVAEVSKYLWPDFNCTKENIQRPTFDFVCRFYTQFLMDIEGKVSSTLGWYQQDEIPELNLEENLCLKMQKLNLIFEQAEMTFLPGDIYQPVFTRTKHFLYMCVHVLQYFENIFPDFEKTVTDILKMREDIEKLFYEKDQILNDNNKYAEQKSQLMEDNEKLQVIVTERETAYEAYCTKRAEKEEQTKEKVRMLERLKRSCEEKTAFLEKLQAKEKRLLEEVVTEEQYLDLKKLSENLEKEKESLGIDDVNLEYALSCENGNLDHFRDCGKAIPDNFNVELVKKELAIEVELDDLQMKREKILSELSSHKAIYTHQDKLHSESEKYCVTANLENHKVLQEISQESRELKQQFQKYKDRISSNRREAFVENVKIKGDIQQIENNIYRLRDHFKKEFIKVAKAEELAIRKFKEYVVIGKQND